MMEYIFIGIVVFLLLLAVFDLFVGVSNDAVNFLNSAVGARAATFRTVLIVASVGVFLGAVSSNGMMDIARHGIFHPEQFSFQNLLCIFMAVMMTDIVLLNTFNSLGLPTSTTVSMVFELLGASVAVSLFKLMDDTTGLSLADLLNTDKAFEVILGIFLSVAIAFVFGTLVQWLTRLWFSFNYKKGLVWKIGLFGGVSATAIVYFLLIKGAKDLVFMTPEAKRFIQDNAGWIVLGCFAASTLLMQLLHLCRVNVFKIIVLMGTFALAMAFAGNDLVNFIGVPITGFASLQDYLAHGQGHPDTFLMSSLNDKATTPPVFLIVSGVVMIISLFTSQKARRVVETSVSLSRQHTGRLQNEEFFGSSRIARHMVRSFISSYGFVRDKLPAGMRNRLDRRFDTKQVILEEDAAFDLVRACVNLVLASMLIALGTSLKLPLSTTYVTFMVAMGTSLSDRAWSRETAVFRITGVVSVIGGWFITAGAAFIGAALLVSLMYWGGVIFMVAVAILAVFFLFSELRDKQTEDKKEEGSLFQQIMDSDDPEQAWSLLKQYLARDQREFLTFADRVQRAIEDGFFNDSVSNLLLATQEISLQKDLQKSQRRKAVFCLQQIPPQVALENSTWFHLAENCQITITYNLRRIAEVCYEHVDNNFRPLPQSFVDEARPICRLVRELYVEVMECIWHPSVETALRLRKQGDAIKAQLSAVCARCYETLRQEESENMNVLFVYVNMMQELQEIVSNLQKLLRADIKLFLSPEAHLRTF